MGELKSSIAEWDSAFFRIKTGIIEASGVDKNRVSDCIDSLFGEGCGLIYLFSDRKVELEGYDMILADCKRSYVMATPMASGTAEDVVKFDGDPEELYELAYQAGGQSRFRIDPHFSEEEFRRLYREWIDNSVLKGFADYVLVVEKMGKPAAMITAKERQGEISIGLFATDVAYRGKGLGGELIQKIVDIAAKKRVRVEVTTQQDNETACRFYESKGFSVAHNQFVYHVWNHSHQLSEHAENKEK